MSSSGDAGGLSDWCDGGGPGGGWYAGGWDCICRYGLFEARFEEDESEVRCEWSSLSPLSLEKNLDILAWIESRLEVSSGKSVSGGSSRGFFKTRAYTTSMLTFCRQNKAMVELWSRQ